MEQGWVWDLDDFTVNQIGHPYQGNNYFNTGRANGLSFYESAAVTAFGSATWEYFGETNHASLNDFINTTLGGIALGEMFHRTAWLVRDTRATGRGRLWSEIGATALDPITGVNRFMRGGCLARQRQARGYGALEPDRVWRSRRVVARHAGQRVLGGRTAISGDGRGLRGSGQGTQPNRLRRIRDEAALRRRIGLQRSPGARAAARTALQGRQAPVQCRAELRLPEKRRLRHRIPKLRGRIRVHTEPVVHDQVLDAGMGRPDRPRRHRFAPARPDRTARRRRRPETRVRASPRGRAITTTDLGRTLARPPSSRGTIARSRRSSTRAVTCSRSTACARTTSCSADASTSCCRCEARSASVSQASTSIDGRSTRTPPHVDTQLPLPAGARLLHVEAVVNLSMRAWVRGLCLLALAPAMAFAQAAPGPSSQPAGGPRTCGWSPAARSRRCAAIVRPASRISRTATPAPCWPTSDIVSIPAWTSAPKCSGCRSTPRRERSAPRTSMPWRSSGPGRRTGSS